ncbi:MAG: phage tail protein [Gammaproteobacteria bacterium]
MAEFIPFRFKVSLLSDSGGEVVCAGQFSEVTGLEVTTEPYTVREGGRNWGGIQRSGHTSFAPIVLKRGATSVHDLWAWFDIVTRGANYGYRMSGEITVLYPGRAAKAALVWKLKNVLPVKFKGPDLSATASQVAVEELHLVHEGLTLERPAAS